MRPPLMHPLAFLALPLSLSVSLCLSPGVSASPTPWHSGGVPPQHRLLRGLRGHRQAVRRVTSSGGIIDGGGYADSSRGAAASGGGSGGGYGASTSGSSSSGGGSSATSGGAVARLASSTGLTMGSLNPQQTIRYYGGPLMTAPLDVFLVYYGNWSAKRDGGQRVFRSFLNSISTPSDVQRWWGITTKYRDGRKRNATAKVRLAGEAYDSYSQGSVLTSDTDQIFSVVRKQLRRGTFPTSAAAAYVVLTSADVKVSDGISSFCNGYCGWHFMSGFRRARGAPVVPIAFGFVGNSATQCPSRCPMDYPQPPPDDAPPGIHGMVSLLAHELSEMVTDPDTLTGYLTDQGIGGLENADVCASYHGRYAAGRWKRGAQKVQGNFNMAGSDGTRFLVQSNLDPTNGLCHIGR